MDVTECANPAANKVLLHVTRYTYYESISFSKQAIVENEVGKLLNDVHDLRYFGSVTDWYQEPSVMDVSLLLDHVFDFFVVEPVSGLAEASDNQNGWIEWDVPLGGEMDEPMGNTRFDEEEELNEFMDDDQDVGNEEVEEWLMASVTPPRATVAVSSTYEAGGPSTATPVRHPLTTITSGVATQPQVIDDLCVRMSNLEYRHGELVKKMKIVSDAENQQLQTRLSEMENCEGTLISYMAWMEEHLVVLEKRRTGPPTGPQLKTARSHQKSYADKRRKPLEFKVRDRVLLKVSPWNGVVRFGKKGKLAPRYGGPFEIVKCIGLVDVQVPLEEIKIDENLRFVEEPIGIVERDVKNLKRRRIPLVKVRWNSRQGAEYTWEREDQFRQKYSHLFSKHDSLEVHANAAETNCAIARYALLELATKISNSSFYIKIALSCLGELTAKISFGLPIILCKTQTFALGDKPHSFFAHEGKPPQRCLNPRPLACGNNLQGYPWWPSELAQMVIIQLHCNEGSCNSHYII
nr:putative reverse transcriptase domain-containing protein [Tanacetum cinerariifolium]